MTKQPRDGVLPLFQDKIEIDGEITTALTCPVCLNLFQQPKLLPNCGHTLCLVCVVAIQKSSSSTVTCPECRCENHLGPNISPEGLKTNFPVQSATEILRKFNAAKSCNLGEVCPHVSVISKSVVTCRHCNAKFCKACLVGHMDRLKGDISSLCHEYDERLQKATADLLQKSEQLKASIRGQVDAIERDVNKTGDDFVEAIRQAVDGVRQRLLKRTRDFGNEELTKIDRLVQWATKQANDGDDHNLSLQVRSLVETPLLQSSIDDFTAIYDAVKGRDAKIFELEKAAMTMTTCDIVFTPDNSALDQLMKIIDPSTIGTVTRRWQHQQQQQCSKDELPHPRELHAAIKDANFDIVKAIFNRSAPFPDYKTYLVEHRDGNDSNRTAIHQAIRRGAVEIVRFLAIDQKADLQCRDNDLTTLHVATMSGLVDMVKFVIDHAPVLLEAKTKYNSTALNIAAWYGNLDIVDHLVNNKSANMENRGGKQSLTPLMQAAENGQAAIVDFLSLRGAKLTAKEDRTGQLAIHFAAANGHVDGVKCLLKRRPDLLEMKDDLNGETALHKAAANGKLDLVKFLVDCKGANARSRNHSSMTPFLLAVANGHCSLVKFMIECNGLHLEDVDNSGNFCIHLAVQNANLEMADCLLKCDPSLATVEQSQSGDTALAIARRLKCNAKLLALLNYCEESNKK